MLRRTSRLALAALLLAGASGIANAQTTSITVSATPSILKDMFEQLVASFEEAHPDIDVQLEIPAGEQETHIQSLLRQAVVEDLPDVTFQSYNYIRTLADRDLTVPLADFVANDPDWSTERYADAVTKTGSVNDTVYALGVGASFPVLYYNADLVAAAQDGDTTFPDNWEEIVTLGEAMSEQEGIVGGFHRFHPWFFHAHVNSRGGQMLNPDETAVAFGGTEGLTGLQVVRDFGEAGQAASAMTREQARQAFVAGTIGLFTDSSGLLAQHLEQIGDRFELGVARWPILAEGGGVPASGVSVMMLTEDEARQAAAWEFMTFLVGPEGQEIVVRNSAYVPVNGAAVDTNKSLTDYFAENPKMGVALETSNDAVAWKAFPGENATKIDEVIYDTVEAVSTLRIAPEAAIEELSTTVDGML